MIWRLQKRGDWYGFCILYKVILFFMYHYVLQRDTEACHYFAIRDKAFWKRKHYLKEIKCNFRINTHVATHVYRQHDFEYLLKKSNDIKSFPYHMQ